MKLLLKPVLFAISIFTAATACAQDIKPVTGTVKLLGTFTFDEVQNSFDPTVLNLEAPKPGSETGNRKAILDEKRKNRQLRPQPIQRKAGSPSPTVDFVTLGNTATGTPNDNDLAVSDSGLIISVLNTGLRIINESGTIIKNNTLKILGKIGGVQNNTFDPRVVYDPIADRFIVVFMNGSTSQNSATIVCFSKTNDPTKEWNAYSLPGANLFRDSTWSDYPIISISEEDLFITLNMVLDNKGFRDGFTESMVWQVRKKEGYDGDTALKFNRWNGFKTGNRNIWSICPAQGGLKPSGPKSYFLSVRPTDFQNDTIFLHEISNTVSSNAATLSTKVVIANRKYGLPPNPEQPNGEKLSTNDGRVLTAMVQNDVIQFAGNCVDTNNYAAGIFHGHFKVTDNTATLNIISSDTVDYGYPDIAYAGTGGGWDNSAMLTFSRVSKNAPAGTVVMYIDRNFVYSDVITVRNGTGSVSLLADSLERWGDYTGIQRKYNEPRSFWLSGSLGVFPQQGCVIAKIGNPDPALSVRQPTQELDAKIYPNPAIELFTVEFNLPQAAYLSFSLYDMSGRLVSKLVEDKVKPGNNRFTFNTLPLAEGVYYLGIMQGNKVLKYEKVIISR